jgi:large subunit ribosomal protein L1
MPKVVSKRYKSAQAVADLSKSYGLAEAADILSKMPKAKFDETVTLSFNLSVDPTQGEQMVRGVVQLPHGSGRKVRIIVFTDKPEEALKAGAAHAGLADLMKKISEGFLDFDVAVSTVAAMKEVRTLARVLGPKGLMPNPKNGTVSDDIPATVKQLQGGRVEFRMDKTGNIGVIIGKRSFTEQAIAENAKVVIETVGKAKPDTFKLPGFIKNVALSSSMSPGITIEKTLYGKY